MIFQIDRLALRCELCPLTCRQIATDQVFVDFGKSAPAFDGRPTGTVDHRPANQLLITNADPQ
jgi:hypothetical protein